MTSTPASRSARATTLAPRSWPSSPAFATITRILPMLLSVTGLSVRRAPARAGRGCSVHAGDAVHRVDHAALRAGGRDGHRRARRGGRAGDLSQRGVGAEEHLDV